MKKIIIIGAGEGGKRLASEILHTKNYHVLGFLDDNSKITKVFEHKVLGRILALSKLALQLKPDEIFIAIPSLRGEKLEKIIDQIQDLNLPVKILPGIFESLIYQKSNRVPAGQLRPVEIGDLLERQKITIDIVKISSYLNNKVVLITGGGGSIGSELARRISEFGPKKLILLDNYENHLYELEQELNNPNNRYVVADIKDKNQLAAVFSRYKPEIVFHAAAHKHVPLMEREPQEAIKNNILGSNNLIEIALQNEIERFVFISSDKAIIPTSIMGATKRFTEDQILKNNAAKTIFAIVRFGNVLGSYGSVVPLWQKQLAQGKSIMVTDAKMTRFFMTIPEAVQLVIQAGAMATDSNIYVLKMGKQYKILDLAKKFLKFSGINDLKNKITIVGVRPGEKLTEILTENTEKVIDSAHPMILEIKKEKNSFNIKNSLKLFYENIDKMNRTEIDQELKKLIPFYTPYQMMKKPIKNQEVLHFSALKIDQEKKRTTLEFEKYFQDYYGTKHVLAVKSAQSGLYLALQSVGAGPGDEVILPSFTSAWNAHVVVQLGAKPVFTDIDKNGYMIDPQEVEKKITQKTKVIIVPHYGGQVAEIETMIKIAKSYKLKVIEDCTLALGAKLGGQLAGTFGDIGVFGFNLENMTLPEGGMVITYDDDLSQKMKILRLGNIGQEKWADRIIPGYKSNLSDLAAAAGFNQLKKLDQTNKSHQEIAQKYLNYLAESDKIILPNVLASREHVWQLFPVLVDPKKHGQIIRQLQEFNIMTQLHFMPLHLMSFYQERFGYKKGDFPISEWVYEREISLPIYPGLRDEQIDYISQVLKYLVLAE